MAVIEFSAPYYNPRHPKCRNCEYWGKSKPSSLTPYWADCECEEAKVRSKAREHNAKACQCFKRAPNGGNHVCLDA